jgi:hypothetical protein
MTREVDSTGASLFQALLLDAMTIYTSKRVLIAALRVKLMKVLYVPRIQQWCPILRSQTDVSGAVD